MQPNTILISSIDFGDRGRKTYSGIGELAQSIEDNGLVQPVVVAPSDGATPYILVAGGRRLSALRFMGVTELHHGVTSCPGTYGYILKSEADSNELQNVLSEIAENLDRENLDWRDEARLIAKAWELAERDAHVHGKEVLARDFGAMIGVPYHDVRAARIIVKDLDENPERYKDCGSARGAMAVLLNHQAKSLTKVAAARDVSKRTARKINAKAPLVAHVDVTTPGLETLTEESVIPQIDLSNAFHNANGLDFLAALAPGSIDHIITDPDYAVSVDTLSSNASGAAAGVAQASVDDSLSDLRRLMPLAYNALGSNGFFVFWYDLDHHEKLQGWASAAGFAVQRWPLIWHKTDYRSNAAPAHNFCKNMEYAMVCRKPGAVLTAVQSSSLFAAASGPVTRELGHPFAKPYEVWRWIYHAVTIRGQRVFDPFVGSGSSAIAALQCGLQPYGCEIDPGHYDHLKINMQNAYRKVLGEVTFI